MLRVPTHQPPTPPGEILLEEFLKPMGITQQELANAIYVPYQRINDIVHDRRGITPSTALRFSKFVGNSVEFWMNLQISMDLYNAGNQEKADLKKIQQYVVVR